MQDIFGKEGADVMEQMWCVHINSREWSLYFLWTSRPANRRNNNIRARLLCTKYDMWYGDNAGVGRKWWITVANNWFEQTKFTKCIYIFRPNAHATNNTVAVQQCYMHSNVLVTRQNAVCNGLKCVVYSDGEYPSPPWCIPDGLEQKLQSCSNSQRQQCKRPDLQEVRESFRGLYFSVSRWWGKFLNR